MSRSKLKGKNSALEEEEMFKMNDIAFKQFNEKALVPCRHCGRTFLPDSLKRHQKRCTADRPFKPLNKNRDKSRPKPNRFDDEPLPAIRNKKKQGIGLDDLMGGSSSKRNPRQPSKPKGRPAQRQNNNYYEDSNFSEMSEEEMSEEIEIPVKSVQKPKGNRYGARKVKPQARNIAKPVKASNFKGIGSGWRTTGSYTYCRPKGGDRPFYGWGSNKTFSKSNITNGKPKRKLYNNEARNRQMDQHSSTNSSNHGSNRLRRNGGSRSKIRNGSNNVRKLRSPMRKPQKKNNKRVSKQLDDFINETFGTMEKSSSRKQVGRKNGRGVRKSQNIKPKRVFIIIF